MDNYKFDIVVGGGGIIGLAISRSLAQSGIKVALIEIEDQLILNATSRNCEVLHSSLYYIKAPIKQEMCVVGQKFLYDYLCKKNIPHKDRW